ncbi:MAG: alpha/beta hydrolase [Bacteroidia bacterium]|jgi:proline iminopeptidase|nr:alpha/beta hydrolase [Bacteroidia bacterium]
MRTIYLLPLLLLFTTCTRTDEIGALVPPTVDQDRSLPSIRIDVAGHSRLIHVRTFGDTANPVLFLIHGSYSDCHPYFNICESLADKYYVVAWDQRGCGLSERITENEFSLETAAEEVSRMKAHYSPHNKITIIGQSWGGGMATLFTAKHPQEVEQLVLIEPIPLTGSDMQQLYKSIVEFTYNNQSWNNMAVQGMVLSADDHAQIDYRAHMILRSNMTAGYHCDGNNPPVWPVHRVGGYMEYLRNKALGNPVSGFTYDFREGISAFSDTVLVMGGSCSSLGYSVQNQYTRPHFSAAQVIEVQNAGHRMNIEKPEEVISIIKNYLNQY